MKIITKRPENMGYEEYREVLKEQKRELKNRKRGIIEYLAVQLSVVGGIVVGRKTAMPRVFSHYDAYNRKVYKPMKKVEL